MHACMCGNQHIGNTHSCLSKQRNLSARGTHHARNLQLVIPTPAWIILSLQLAPGMPESAPEGVVVTCMLRSQLIACAALHLRGLHHGILTQRSLDNWTSGRALPDNNRKFCMALGFLMMITYPYGYAHFYPAEPEHSSAPRSGQAPGRTLGQRARAWLPSIQRRQQHATTEAACEVEEARQHHLGMQQQQRMRQQPEMRPQPLLPVPSAQLPSLTQQHPAAGSCMVPAGSGRDRRRLNAAGAAALYGLPSPLQATGTADLRHMHPQQLGGSTLPSAAQPGLTSPIPSHHSQSGFTSPIVPSQHPQLSTPPRPFMRSARPPAAAPTQLQSVMRAALGPRVFKSLRSLMTQPTSSSCSTCTC